MDESTREVLMGRYFDAIDSESYHPFTELFTADSRHIRPGQDVLRGLDEIRSFFEHERRSSNTTHQTEWVRHIGNESYCKVVVSGELTGAEYEGEVICEFGFDTRSETISKYKVYRGYDR